MLDESPSSSPVLVQCWPIVFAAGPTLCRIGWASHVHSKWTISSRHPPGSKSWHSEAVRPSLAELAIPSTYCGREEDLDIEYSLVFQKMSFQCWPAVCDVGSPLIQPSRTLRWDVVVCVWDVSGELLGQQTCVVKCRAGVVDSGPTLKQYSCQRSNLGQTEKYF